MSISYTALKRNKNQFKSITGFSIEHFDLFHEHFALIWNNYIRHFTVEGQRRVRRKSLRKDSVFSSTQDMLLFILSFLKNNPLQEYHAANYSMTQPRANVWIQLLTKLIYKTLDKIDQLPSRNDKALESVLKQVSDAFIDGVERGVQRPMDYEVQKEYYSGKKKDIE